MLSRELDDKSYHKISEFLEQQCGIVLGENKQYLVKSRLSPLLNKFDLNSLEELVTRTLSSAERQLRAAVIDAMTTNETLWFRDEYPFRLLQNKVLPVFSNKRTPVKIWSAASSSGQEPYSIAISILEYQKNHPGSFARGIEVVGTDISTTMLEHCKRGQYDSLALARGLSEERKKLFFENGDNRMLKVKDEVKKMVTFRSLNLLNSYSLMGRFDIIFCRNVLIYFAPEIKARILSQIHGALNEGGYLFLGASESLSGLNDNFNMIRCNPGIIYQKK